MNNVNPMSFSGSLKWPLFSYWFLSSPDHCISCLRSAAFCHVSISPSLVCPVHSTSGSIKTTLASIFITLMLRIAQYCVCPRKVYIYMHARSSTQLVLKHPRRKAQLLKLSSGGCLNNVSVNVRWVLKVHSDICI